MLTDFERKILRIFINSQHMKKGKPTVDDFTRLTGKNKMDIFRALQELAKKGYIHWSDGNTQTIEVIREFTPTVQTRTSMDLWLK